MRDRLKLRGIAEIPIGTDEVMAALFRDERGRLGVSIADVAAATGAFEEEIQALESGAIAAFDDHERLRGVILAYSDYLEMDPTPILARLESYGRWQTVASPNLFAMAPMRGISPAFSRLLVVLCAIVLGGAVFWMAAAGF